MKARGASYILIISSVLSLFSLALSCRREDDRVILSKTDDISFIVSEGKPFATKSGEAPSENFSEMVFSKDSFDIYLQASESIYSAGYDDILDVDTKGAPYDNSQNKIGTFHVTAYHSQNTNPFFSISDVTYNGSEPAGTGFYWPVTTPPAKISFFGYAKSNDNGSLLKNKESTEKLPEFIASDNNQEGGYNNLEGKFWYQLPDPSAVVDSDDAEKHPDIVFAIAPNQQKSDQPIELKFYHALSAITFISGDIPGKFQVDSISFTGISSSAMCEYSLSDNGDLTFDWSDFGDDMKYTQKFEKRLYDADGNPLQETSINTLERTFMMIPQDMGDADSLNVNISFEGRRYKIRKPLKGITPKWEAGKRYTFRISSPDEVEVEVEDVIEYEGEYPVKKNLTITNTGISSAYIRAAIVGNWVVPYTENDNTQYDIIANWDVEEEVSGTGYGEFKWADNGGEPSESSQSGWCKYQGYYYFLQEVEAGEPTTPLFDSYKLNKFYPMVDNAELELIIAVQAVHPKDLETVWPEEVRNKLPK